ncbi:MAG: DUF2225 domain-containing protein [Thermacetogeniaceae bacterium]
MDNGTLLKKVNAGSRIVFDDPDRLFCLVFKGKINTAAPGQRQEVGPGGVINSSMYAYAIEGSELLFINLEKLKKLKPDLAAKIAGGMKEKDGAGPGRPAAKQEKEGAGPGRPAAKQEKEGAGPGRPAAKQERTTYSYSVDVQCPVCKGHFKANKMFESKLKQLSHDAEMRTRFEDIEPIHYKVWVCPDCLYANFMNRWSDLSSSQISTLKESVEKRKSILSGLPEPGGNAEKALNDYRLAIECLTQIKAVSNVIGSAWVNLAWLYDDLGAVDLAAAARKNSLAAYEEYYFQERSMTPSLELQVLYIIGQLNKKLGNVKKAHEYFLKVLQYKDHSMAILTDLARDGLQELKRMTKETA